MHSLTYKIYAPSRRILLKWGCRNLKHCCFSVAKRDKKTSCTSSACLQFSQFTARNATFPVYCVINKLKKKLIYFIVTQGGGFLAAFVHGKNIICVTNLKQMTSGAVEQMV